MKNFKAQYIFNGILFVTMLATLAVYVGIEIPWPNPFLSGFYNFLVGIGFLVLVAHSLWECDERTPEEYEDLLQTRFLPVRFPGTVVLVVLFSILGHRAWIGGGEMKKINNANVVYTTSYKQKTQAIASLYDMSHKTFKQQFQLAGISQEGLKYFTDAIFNARKDGANLAWKWTHENTAVPYEQFLQLYSSLSAFVEKQRGQIYLLEVERANIVKSQNALLDSFPNNLYNNLLNLKKLEYKAVLLSDKTEQAISSGKEENL